MAQVASITTKKFLDILRSDTGLRAAASVISMLEGEPVPEIPNKDILGQNASSELVDRNVGSKYPAMYVYCARVTNSLREKFRTFSGQAQLTAEIRVSQDRLEGIERQLQLQVDAVTEVLDRHRGDWGNGMFYTGGYEVNYGPIKHGGKNYLQTAKITFEVEISK